MTKITTCQICGREIKARRGWIAHHGYQRPGGGWQTSSCFGAGARPYEESCDQIKVAIERTKEDIVAIEKMKHDFLENPPETVTTAPRYLGQKTFTYDRPADFVFDPADYRGDKYHRAYRALFMGMESNLRAAREQLIFLNKRLADWRPA